MNAILVWVEAHPVLFNTVLWPLVSAIALLLFKPRSPEDYAKMNPRLAGFLIFLSGLGLDIPKALEGLKRVITGKALTVGEAQARDLLEKANVKDGPKSGAFRDGDPPGAASTVLLLIGAAFIVSQTTACGVLTPRNLRNVLDITQTACIIAHQTLPESDVAKVCGVVDDLIPPMRQILAESRKASAKAADDAATKAGASKCVDGSR